MSSTNAACAQRLSASRIISVYRSRKAIRRSCAQRLSASRIISVAVGSTPGLYEGAQRLSASRIISGAMRPRSSSAVPIVLNAFRHHGLYRMVGSVSRSFRRQVIRAQRLSASRIISGRCLPRAGPAHGGVLNAFRHHGLYRSGDAPGGASCGSSTGAQRLSASRIISGTPGRPRRPSASACSTPFGITDYIGQAHGGRASPAQMCSTPFGITDYIGFRPQRRHWCDCLDGAQRLSASRIISAAAGRPCSAFAHHVLNAFRHHGLYRTCFHETSR